ncbi:MAG: ribonuclease R, partial [Rhodospirillales bacterium]|nr:ribonuclease R [Rhodospirillales bacterium]
LEESGADGLVPIRTLPDDYYIHDESRHSLTGRTNGLEYRLGDQVETMLMEADPVTGGMILQILDDGVAKPRKSRRPQSAGKGRKPQGRNIKSAGVKAGRPKKTKRGRRR